MFADYDSVLHGFRYTGYYAKNDSIYHRVSGPARIWHANHPFYPGRQEWYLFGEQINVSSQQEFEKYLKMKAFW